MTQKDVKDDMKPQIRVRKAIQCVKSDENQPREQGSPSWPFPGERWHICVLLTVPMTNDTEERTASGRRRTPLHLVAELGELRTWPLKAAGPRLFGRGRADGKNRETAFY